MAQPSRPSLGRSHRPVSIPLARVTAGAVLAVVLVAGSVGAVRAQEFDFRLIRPMVTVTGTYMPDEDFKDVDGQQYGNRNASFLANIPLGSVHVHVGGGSKILASQWMLTLGGGATDQTLDIVPRQPRLYNGLFNVSYLFASHKPNLHYISAGGSFAEDQDTLSSNLDPRVSALYLGTYRKSDRTTFIYGGAYSFVYGRGLLLPAFGLIWTPNATWSLTGAVPFYWRVSQKFNEQFRLNYLLYAAGQRYGFKNDNDFAGVTDDKVYERVTEQRLAAEAEYHPARGFTLLLQAGVAVARRLGFSTLDSSTLNLLDEPIKPAPYARLAFRFPLGKSVVDELQDHLKEVAGEP
ncbi:MAG TPA: DUF6268 family outer membrane beta-barrel protein [Candidatus Polarisedimenticolia bacterium]|jgi:hypothetical protein|nr:DUF6268 family outer membrane beta-barrel protein [Candidatus Polarisedimenticolia bacterium]